MNPSQSSATKHSSSAPVADTSQAKRRVITVRRELLAGVHGEADAFRRAQAAQGTLIVNLISSPGAGKTSLLAAMAEYWGSRRRMAVLVGDIATDRDAQRIAPYAPVVQLTTGGACHLEFPLVARGWESLREQFGAAPLDFLCIENIGNLVCPASHDLGEHQRVLLLSTTEGDDKPAKYPKAFRTSHAVVISKCDLLPYLPFSVESATEDAHSIQSELSVFPVSVRPWTGVAEWCDYLDAQRHKLLAGEICRPQR